MERFNLFLTLVLFIIGIIALRHLYVSKWRKKIMSKPVRPEWTEILQNNLAIYKSFPLELKNQLNDLMKVFIAEKNFEGCGGLKITEEIKVTIAAQACLLMLNRKPTFYSNLDSILVYPSSYFAKDIEPLASGAYLVSESYRMGESWKKGMVVLAWDHVKKGALDMDDGHNVVYHEFAHQLDEEDKRHADGVPVLTRPSSYVTWARIFCREFEKLKRDLIRDSETVIDEYGSVNPAEFFAVATESFFEKAERMKERHPALYKVMKDYYKLDPAKWSTYEDHN